MTDPILLSAKDIAHHYGVKVGTVWWWASVDQWTPHGTRRHRKWDLNEAQNSWDNRHPQPEEP